MPIQGDFIELKASLEAYRDAGYFQQVEWAVKHAQCATREFIERLHPATGFDGKDLLHAQLGNGTDNLIQKGKFDVLGHSISADIYANYWARWYNTGVYIHGIRRDKRGRRDYPNHMQPPRGEIFRQNEQAIRAFFTKSAQDYLQRIIKVRS